MATEYAAGVLLQNLNRSQHQMVVCDFVGLNLERGCTPKLARPTTIAWRKIAEYQETQEHSEMARIYEEAWGNNTYYFLNKDKIKNRIIEFQQFL